MGIALKLAVGVTLGVVLFPALYIPCAPAPRLATQQRLVNISQAMRWLESQRPLPIEDQLRFDGVSGDPAAAWETFVQRHLVDRRTTPEEWRKAACRDGWGRPLCVEYKSKLIGRGITNDLVRWRYGVVVWSRGPNGRDDRGEGDDVVLPVSAGIGDRVRVRSSRSSGSDEEGATVRRPGA